MIKISNRLKNLNALITQNIYTIDTALLLLKKFNNIKFVEAIEAHINLNINPKYINQQIHSNLILPHKINKSLRIAVFTENSLISEMLEAGAIIAANETLITNILMNNIQFDILLTTPLLVPKLAKVRKILSSKGLMPSIKSGTVTSNLNKVITEFKAGRFDYYTDKAGIIHLKIGNTSFSDIQLKENLFTIYNSIEKNKPNSIKGRFFKSVYICNTMSPSLKIDLNSLK